MAWRGEVEDGVGWGGLVPSKAERLAEKRQEHADKCTKACAGLPDGALDGGWTAAGIMAYAARLEQALAPFAKHPEFLAPDDWAVTIIDETNRTAGVTAGDFRRARNALGRG